MNTNAVALAGTTPGDSVQITGSATDMLGLLRVTFTNSKTVLAELLQNSRRAGATVVEILLEGETLRIRDNGCGIADFRVLFAIARSGWDEATQRADAPYGAGFLAAAFACEGLVITSRGQRLAAATAHIVAGQPAVLTAAEDDGWTEIALECQGLGDVHAIYQALKGYVRGFPVPVFFNGEELPRPFAVGNTDLVDSPIGKVSPGVLLGQEPEHYFLQGLPIEAQPRGRFVYPGWSLGDGTRCVHLDPALFKGRMPDRAQLLEPSESFDRIRSGLQGAARERLAELAASMDPAAFVKEHWEAAEKLKMVELLNALPFLADKHLYVLSAYPRRTPVNFDADYVSPVISHRTPIPRAQLEASGIWELDPYDFDGGDALHAMVAHVVGVPVVDNAIPKGHWAEGLVKAVKASDFVLETGKELGRGTLDCWDRTVDVVLVESLGVTAADTAAGRLLLEGSRSLPFYFDPEASELLVTEAAIPCTDRQTLVRQVADFSDDGWDEDAEDETIDRLGVLLDSLRGKPPVEVFSGMIRNCMNMSPPDLLKGRAFKVTFDAAGVMSFEDA